MVRHDGRCRQQIPSLCSTLLCLRGYATYLQFPEFSYGREGPVCRPLFITRSGLLGDGDDDAARQFGRAYSGVNGALHG